MTLAKGTIVRMSEGLKAKLRGKCGVAGKHLGPFDGELTPGYVIIRDEDCWGCSSAHVAEFEDCDGIVIGPLNYNNPGESDPTKIGPEVDVRWQPSNLLYGYDPAELDIVSEPDDP